MTTRHVMTGQVFQPSGQQVRKKLKASRKMKGFQMKPGYLYTVVRAISARVNQNYDGWPSDELKKSAHTFIGKPVFVNHENEDPTKARGVVVAARYVENGNDKYIECIQEIDARRFPRLAAEIKSGGLDSVSMGAEAGFTICSYCGNRAVDEPDFCDHVKYHKGQTLPRYNRKTGRKEDVLVYESCHKLGFFELSYVFDPADETSVATKVLVASVKPDKGSDFEQQVLQVAGRDIGTGPGRFMTGPTSVPWLKSPRNKSVVDTKRRWQAEPQQGEDEYATPEERDPFDPRSYEAAVLRVAGIKQAIEDCPPGVVCQVFPDYPGMGPGADAHTGPSGGAPAAGGGAPAAGTGGGTPVPGGGVPLIRKPDGTYTSPDPAWAHLIDRESGGRNIKQQIHDVNSGGNEGFGLFQITPGTWSAHGGQGSVYESTPEQQAAVAANILRSNPSGSDWGAGMAGREDAAALSKGLQQPTQPAAAAPAANTGGAAGTPAQPNAFEAAVLRTAGYRHAEKCHYCSGDAEEGFKSCSGHRAMEQNKFPKKSFEAMVLEAAGYPAPENSQRTQRPGTMSTYSKAHSYFDQMGAPHSGLDGVLDYGAGLGHSAQFGHTYEPYPREDRDFKPTYVNPEEIPEGKFGRVTNLNVLNVVPPNVRDQIVDGIGRAMAPGGHAVITTRGRDVYDAADQTPIKGDDGPFGPGVIINRGRPNETYQKGFHPDELHQYVQSRLGDGFAVKKVPLGPAGVHVVKNAGKTASFEQKVLQMASQDSDFSARVLSAAGYKTADGVSDWFGHNIADPVNSAPTSPTSAPPQPGTTPHQGAVHKDSGGAHRKVPKHVPGPDYDPRRPPEGFQVYSPEEWLNTFPVDRDFEARVLVAAGMLHTADPVNPPPTPGGQGLAPGQPAPYAPGINPTGPAPGMPHTPAYSGYPAGGPPPAAPAPPAAPPPAPAPGKGIGQSAGAGADSGLPKGWERNPIGVGGNPPGVRPPGDPQNVQIFKAPNLPSPPGSPVRPPEGGPPRAPGGVGTPFGTIPQTNVGEPGVESRGVPGAPQAVVPDAGGGGGGKSGAPEPIIPGGGGGAARGGPGAAPGATGLGPTPGRGGPPPLAAGGGGGPPWRPKASLDKKFEAAVLRAAGYKYAWGELEAPTPVNTLREEGSAPEDDTNDFEHYVEPPDELKTPDLSQAAQIDREQQDQGAPPDQMGGQPPDTDTSGDDGQYMILKIPVPQSAPQVPPQDFSSPPPAPVPAPQGPPPQPPQAPPAAGPMPTAAKFDDFFRRYYGHRVDTTLVNTLEDHSTNRNTRKGTAMGNGLVDRGKVASRNRRQHFADTSGHTDGGPYGRNDEGEQEEAFINSVFGEGVPPPEPVAAPSDGEPDIRNTENNLVAKVQRGREQLLHDARQLAALRGQRTGSRHTAEEVADKVDPSLTQTTGPAAEELTGDDFQSANPNDGVVETQPKNASLDAFAAFDRWLSKASGYRCRDLREAAIKRAAEEYSVRTGSSVQHLFPALSIVLREARKNEAAIKAAAKNRKRGKGAAMRKRADEKLDVAAPDDRIDVERPVADETDAEAQASQFDLRDFGNNAGDNIADPDLSTNQNWAPGDGKKNSSRQRPAGELLAMRCAEAMIEAGLEPNNRAHRYQLAQTYAPMARGVVLDRIAMAERFVQVRTADHQTYQNEMKKVASGGSRGATRSPVPIGLTQGVARTASTRRTAANDPNNDTLLFG